MCAVIYPVMWEMKLTLNLFTERTHNVWIYETKFNKISFSRHHFSQSLPSVTNTTATLSPVLPTPLLTVSPQCYQHHCNSIPSVTNTTATLSPVLPTPLQLCPRNLTISLGCKIFKVNVPGRTVTLKIHFNNVTFYHRSSVVIGQDNRVLSSDWSGQSGALIAASWLVDHTALGCIPVRAVEPLARNRCTFLAVTRTTLL